MSESGFTYRKASIVRRTFIDPVPPSRRIGSKGRIIYLILLSGVAFVLYMAMTLEANLTGFGTHRKLGLNRCSMIQLLNVPCPFCGMTTGFTNMVHLEFIEAAKAQPFGVFFFTMFAVSIPVLLYGLLRGYAVHQLVMSNRFDLYLDLFFGLMALSYAYKIMMFIQLYPRQ